MKYFAFSASDPLSDMGCAQVVVYALNILVAEERLKRHLKGLKREDLDMKLVSVMPDDMYIIYSNVEARS